VKIGQLVKKLACGIHRQQDGIISLVSFIKQEKRKERAENVDKGTGAPLITVSLS
jgi:hypothetical protein